MKIRRFAALMISLSLLVLACDENIESVYESYNDLVADRALERGWIPARLPSTATDIAELHNLDTNRVWGRFRNKSNSVEWLLGCEDAAGKRDTRTIPRRVEWWDEQSVLDASVAMRCNGENRRTVLFFLDKTSDVVFFYVERAPPGG